jgi:GH25 family lysozyme M1 (1,4-beta-N-acetylmuramidase)
LPEKRPSLLYDLGLPGEETLVPVRARRWLISACCAVASVALLGLAATPAGAARSARPGDRANVGATHSPELLSQLRDRSGNVPLTGTGELGPAALAPAAIAGDEQGVDVASFQHPAGAAIDWSQVAASGIGFAAVKATEGAYYKNPYALTDLAGAEAAGLSVAAYAFAIPNGNGSSNSPVTQANYLLKYLGSYAAVVPVMLDIEYNPYSGGQCYGVKGSKMVAWVAAFDAQIQARTGRMPIIYTPPAWWDSCTGNNTGFGPDPLWVPSITTGSPVLPDGWANWTIWQYSGTGTVPGIDATGATDLDQASAAFLGLLNPGSQDQSDGAPAGLQLRQAIPAPGQTVSYTATGLPPGVSLTGSGNLTGWLTRAGRYLVQISASDAAGATESQSFSWTVTAATGQGPAGPVRFGVGGKCLDDVGNRSANGTPVALGTCTGGAAQWTAAADRTLRIHGQCLSVSRSARRSGAREVLEPCAGYASQQWAVGTGAHLVNGGAGLCLSGSASGTTGSRVWLGSCATGASRAWTLPAGPVQSQLPGQCVASSSQAGGAVVLAPCSGLAAQQWAAQPGGTVRQAGQCLAVAGAGTASGTGVDLAACTGGPGQQWQIDPAGAGQQLANPQSGLCLADPGDSTASGTQLVIASCTGGDPGTGWRLP